MPVWHHIAAGRAQEKWGASNDSWPSGSLRMQVWPGDFHIITFSCSWDPERRKWPQTRTRAEGWVKGDCSKPPIAKDTNCKNISTVISDGLFLGWADHVLCGKYSNVLVLHTEAEAQMTQEKHNLEKKTFTGYEAPKYFSCILDACSNEERPRGSNFFLINDKNRDE